MSNTTRTYLNDAETTLMDYAWQLQFQRAEWKRAAKRGDREAMTVAQSTGERAKSLMATMLDTDTRFESKTVCGIAFDVMHGGAKGDAAFARVHDAADSDPEGNDGEPMLWVAR